VFSSLEREKGRQWERVGEQKRREVGRERVCVLSL
jgi:hypothetical protein